MSARGHATPTEKCFLVAGQCVFFDWAWQCKIFYHSIGSPYNSSFFAENRSQDALEGLRALGLALSDYFLFSCFGLVAMWGLWVLVLQAFSAPLGPEAAWPPQRQLIIDIYV